MKLQRISLALISTLAFALGLVTPSVAEDFKMPEKKPVVSVTFPDSWKPEETDAGVQGQTKDTAVYMAIEASRSEKGMNAIIDGTFDMFKEHKVDVDKSTKKESTKTIAGQEASVMTFTGKDEDGPTTVSLTIFTVKDTVIVISYWATTAKEAKYSDAVDKLVSSSKAR